jgi:predicted metal-dependent enzyme (double-stranded beta helix superfamily)
MFDLDQLIADCRAALAADSSHNLVRELVAKAVSDPAAVLRGLGEPKRAQLQKLYHAPDLTILNVIWAPTMTIMPHDHCMWAVIGLYTGREDNISGGASRAIRTVVLRRAAHALYAWVTRSRLGTMSFIR